MIQVPTTEIDGDIWLLLNQVLGKKIVFRAHSIEKRKERVKDPSDHRVDEAIAEGGVKCKSKHYALSNYVQ